MEKAKSFRSVGTRFSIASIAIVSLIIIGFSIFVIWDYQKTMYSELKQRMILASELSVISLALPIWELNFAHIEDVADAIFADPSIVHVDITDFSGINLAQKNPPDTKQWRWALFEASEDYLTQKVDIIHEGNRVGVLRIAVTTKAIQAQIKEKIFGVLALTLFLIIAITLTSIFITRRHIVRPLGGLVDSSIAIAAGDIQVPTTARLNDKNRTKDEIGILTEAFGQMQTKISDVMAEINDLAQSIQAGKFESRGSTEKFTGAWGDLVIGVNNVINAFSQPFKTTASYLERVSVGDIPPRINENYQGDFNNIKNNLNLLIDATNSTTRIAEEIASGNIAIEARERCSQDRMMFALNKMIQKLNENIEETGVMIQAAKSGQLDIRGRSEEYSGVWRDLIEGINELIMELKQSVSTATAASKEMELARQIQTVLLPDNIRMSGYEVFASCAPADEVGGDYFDVISAGGIDWIVVGDVSGHGLTSGLIMMMVQTSIHTVLLDNPGINPADLLVAVNRAIYQNIQKMDESMHMTIVALASELDGNFKFTGLHEDILIRRADTLALETVTTDGMWIGLEPDISHMLNDGKLRLNPKDCLVLFTDGILEARGYDHQMYGIERLSAIIRESGDKSAREIHNDILQSLEPYETDDDITLLVMKRNGEMEAQQKTMG